MNMYVPAVGVGFEFFTELCMQTVVFWVVAQCSILAVYQRFRGRYCLHLQSVC